MNKYSKLTGIYMSPEMHYNLQMVATKNHLSVSEYVRRLINQDSTYRKQKEQD